MQQNLTPLSRRGVLASAAWSVPAVTIAAAAPAHASSAGGLVLSWTSAAHLLAFDEADAWAEDETFTETYQEPDTMTVLSGLAVIQSGTPAGSAAARTGTGTDVQLEIHLPTAWFGPSRPPVPVEFEQPTGNGLRLVAAGAPSDAVDLTGPTVRGDITSPVLRFVVTLAAGASSEPVTLRFGRYPDRGASVDAILTVDGNVETTAIPLLSRAEQLGRPLVPDSRVMFTDVSAWTAYAEGDLPVLAAAILARFPERGTNFANQRAAAFVPQFNSYPAGTNSVWNGKLACLPSGRLAQRDTDFTASLAFGPDVLAVDSTLTFSSHPTVSVTLTHPGGVAQLVAGATTPVSVPLLPGVYTVTGALITEAPARPGDPAEWSLNTSAITYAPLFSTQLPAGTTYTVSGTSLGVTHAQTVVVKSFVEAALELVS